MFAFLFIVLLHHCLKFLPWWCTLRADYRCTCNTTASQDPSGVCFVLVFYKYFFQIIIFLKGSVCIFTFFHTVTSSFLLFCGLEDSTGILCSNGPALPTPFTCWRCRAQEQPPCPLPGSRSSTAVQRGRTGRTQLFPTSHPWGCQECERQACSARMSEGGCGPQSHFQHGQGILAPPQCWLEGDALQQAEGRFCD